MAHTLLTLVLGAFAATIPAYAHHSFASYYHENQSVTISGEVREFRYRNPHAVLMVDVKDTGGIVRTYAAEFAGPSRLAAQGVTGDTLRPGDFVVVTGSPGRNPEEYKVHLKNVHRPADGWSWSGRGGRRR